MHVSLAALKIAEEQKFNLDDAEAFAKIVPEAALSNKARTQIITGWEGEGADRKMQTKPNKTGVTLRQCLTHTSGIPYMFGSDLALPVVCLSADLTDD